MAYYTYTFTHRSFPTGTSTVLTNVTSWSQRAAKANLLDPLQPVTAQINGNNLAGLPTIKVGDIVEVSTGGSGISFGGFVADFKIYYGKVANEDRWTISLEDAVAYLGRATVTVSWAAGVTTRAAAIAVATAAGIGFSGSVSDTSKSLVSAQSFTDTNALEIYRTLAITEQARVIAGYTTSPWEPTLNFVGRNVLTTAGRFSDATPSGLADSDWRYESVDFAALADNVAQKVIVQPAGLAAQTAGSGNRVYSLSTYDQTTGQALNLAQYVDAVLSSETVGPERIGVIMEAQVTPTFPGDVTTILLRSASYNANVLGRNVDADPASTRISWDLASGATTNWLVLDNPTLGKLDNNKLGF